MTIETREDKPVNNESPILFIKIAVYTFLMLSGGFFSLIWGSLFIPMLSWGKHFRFLTYLLLALFLIMFIYKYLKAFFRTVNAYRKTKSNLIWHIVLVVAVFLFYPLLFIAGLGAKGGHVDREIFGYVFALTLPVQSILSFAVSTLFLLFANLSIKKKRGGNISLVVFEDWKKALKRMYLFGFLAMITILFEFYLALIAWKF